MAGCMEGIKIIELGHVVAVPSAAAILADWGADVIKVEAPGVGDQTRGMTHLEGGKVSNGIHYMFEVMNRNKRSITLNLKNEQGKEIMYALVKQADVFVSNFQPNALATLGMDYEVLSRLNPRLIYATITGYGEKGPKKDKPGYDYAAFWAYSGMMDKFSDPNGLPRRQRPGFGDNITSICIVSGISAALFGRERTGQGQRVSFSLYNTAMWALQDDIQVALCTGEELPYGNIKKTRNPLWNAYQTRDGYWLELCMLQSNLFWPRFCHATGLAQLEHDPRFESHQKREENCEVLITIINEAFSRKPADEWEKILEANDLFYSRVQTVKEVVNDRQAIDNDFFMDFDHPTVGPIKLVASPVLFNGERPPIKLMAPQLGQHTEEILLEFGYNWEDIASLRDGGAI